MPGHGRCSPPEGRAQASSADSERSKPVAACRGRVPGELMTTVLTISDSPSSATCREASTSGAGISDGIENSYNFNDLNNQ